MNVVNWVKNLVAKIKWLFFVWKPKISVIGNSSTKEQPAVQPLFKNVDLLNPMMVVLPPGGVRKYDLREVMTIAESLTKPRRDEQSRILFGYHVEEVGFGEPLSMETLRDDLPLFLGHNAFDWLPGHLEGYKERFRVYVVSFMEPKLTWQTNVHENYINGFETIRSEKPGEEGVFVRYELLSFKSFFETGYHMFSVGKNDKNEHAETMLMHPRRYVFSIKDVTDSTFESCDTFEIVDEYSRNHKRNGNEVN